jgi:predicted MFS family arabinose efflux permease
MLRDDPFQQQQMIARAIQAWLAAHSPLPQAWIDRLGRHPLLLIAGTFFFVGLAVIALFELFGWPEDHGK